MKYLTRMWGIRDRTDELDPSAMPIAGGGFGDIFQGTGLGGMQVAIKTMRAMAEYRGLEVSTGLTSRLVRFDELLLAYSARA
jgi:hypothetical protein